MTEEAGAADTGKASSVARLPGIATVLVPVLLTVAGQTVGQLLEFALFAVAMLPWVAVSVWPSWPHHRKVFAAALTVAFAAGGIGVRLWQQRPVATAGTVRSAPAEPVSDLAGQAQRLRFLPVAEPIPYCANFAGTGTIPAQDVLILFDRPADADGNPAAGSLFNYDGRATATAGGWVADGRWIGSGKPGDNGEHAVITALLVPRSVADLLDGVRDAYTSPWPSAVLRQGAVADSVVVTRGADDTPCP